MYNWKTERNYKRLRDENGNVIANVIYVDGVEVPVSDEVYEAYASMDRRERYLAGEADSSENLSFERCVDDGVPFELLYENGRSSMEERLVKKEQIRALRQAIQMLSVEDQDLIHDLFFLSKTTRDYAQKCRVSQPAIIKRKQRVLHALKKYGRL